MFRTLCVWRAHGVLNMEQNEPAKKEVRPKTPNWSSPFWYIPVLLLLLWFWQGTLTQLNYRSIPYSEFKGHVRRNEVASVVIKPEEIQGELYHAEAVASHATPGRKSDGSEAQVVKVPQKGGATETNGAVQGTNVAAGGLKPVLFRTIRVEDPKLIDDLVAAGVKFRGERAGIMSQLLLFWIMPLAVLVLLWSFVGRRLKGAGESILSFGKSKARLVAEKETGISFSDVAGCEEAKYELQEVVDFLKNPGRYKSIGASIPKGVLLIGPPGTGKTLLAKAVAGEAHAPFFSLSGSDFVEMFVGVGAARVRDLFQQAKAKAPCIIFIDELDAIGRQRGVHVGAVNDEREQTLNQLLVELDGFAANAGVIVLAATNRPDVLDHALLRPGRFDRQVVVDAPDIDGREAILKVHVRGKPLAQEVDLRRIARATPGFSGADLANAVNEAALLAARRDSRQIAQKDLEDAVEKVVAGPERKSRRLGEEEKRRVAYHETGHALVAAYSRFADPVHKISVIPRGRAALGYTLQVPTGDRFLMTRTQLLERIRGMLGGRAAEEVVFGEVTTGAENDLEHATALARQMVCIFGMSEAIGLSRCAQKQNGYVAVEGGFQRDCSEQTAREIDREVKKILDACYADARDILQRHRNELESVTNRLMQDETIDAETFNELIGRAPGHAERSSTPPVELAPAPPVGEAGFPI